jgi:hypothetical protein
MKYFTPELMLRFGSDDEVVALAASEEWDRRQAIYRDHLKQLGPTLPRSVRGLLKRFYLHDAKVFTIALDDRSTLVVNLLLDGENNGGLQLTYRLVAPPTIHRHPEIAEPCTPPQWLYDEIDAAENEPGVFTHNILLTNGSELELRFRNLTVKRFRKMLSLSGKLQPEESTRELELLAS